MHTFIAKQYVHSLMWGWFPVQKDCKRNFYFLYNVVFLLEEKKKRSSVSNDDVVQRANQLKNCTGSYQKRPTFLVEKNSLYFLNSVWELYALSDVFIRFFVNACSTWIVCVLLCVIFLENSIACEVRVSEIHKFTSTTY